MEVNGEQELTNKRLSELLLGNFEGFLVARTTKDTNILDALKIIGRTHAVQANVYCAKRTEMSVRHAIKCYNADTGLPNFAAKAIVFTSAKGSFDGGSNVAIVKGQLNGQITTVNIDGRLVAFQGTVATSHAEGGFVQAYFTTLTFIRGNADVVDSIVANLMKVAAGKALDHRTAAVRQVLSAGSIVDQIEEQGAALTTKERKDLALAKMAEMKLAKEANKLIDKADVERHLAYIGGIIVASIGGIPNDILAVTGDRDVYDAVALRCEAIQHELRTRIGEIASDE